MADQAQNKRDRKTTQIKKTNPAASQKRSTQNLHEDFGGSLT